MTVRGNWGGGNSHGHFVEILNVVRLMKDMDDGKEIHYMRLNSRSTAPQFFDGKKLSPEGKETLEKLKRILPCIWSQQKFK